MMYILCFLLNSLASDDVFDLSDKKAKVNKGNYFSFDIHHDAPTQKKYVYGYYVYEPTRRDEVVSLIEEATSVVHQKFSESSCEKFDIAYFFIKEKTISQFSFPTTIVHTKDDFYVFVCSDCEEKESEQLISLYTQVLERICSTKSK
jgi:hypothetical protein